MISRHLLAIIGSQVQKMEKQVSFAMKTRRDFQYKKLARKVCVWGDCEFLSQGLRARLIGHPSNPNILKKRIDE